MAGADMHKYELLFNLTDIPGNIQEHGQIYVYTYLYPDGRTQPILEGGRNLSPIKLHTF